MDETLRVKIVNMGTDVEPRWRAVCGGVEIGRGPHPGFLEPFVEELNEDPSKAAAVRAAVLAGMRARARMTDAEEEVS